MIRINEIYFGKCEDIMIEIPNEFIDHIICDLPYFQVSKDEWDNNWKNEEEYLIWISKIFNEYNRILKNDGNLFLFTGRKYYRPMCNILDKYFIEKRQIIWSRKRNFNTTRGHSLSSGYEPIAYYSKGKNAIFNNIKIFNNINRKEYTEGILKNGVNLSDCWNDINALPHNSPEKLNHSAQKPLKLIERLVELGSNKGDLILDNCCGTGTLGVACFKLNRNYILIENNKEKYEISLNRMNNLKNSIL